METTDESRLAAYREVWHEDWMKLSLQRVSCPFWRPFRRRRLESLAPLYYRMENALLADDLPATESVWREIQARGGVW